MKPWNTGSLSSDHSTFLASLVPHFLTRQITLIDIMEEVQSVWSTVYGFEFPTNHVSSLKICETAGISHAKVIHFGLQTDNLRTACWKVWHLVTIGFGDGCNVYVKTRSAIWYCSLPALPFYKPNHCPDAHRGLFITIMPTWYPG